MERDPLRPTFGASDVVEGRAPSGSDLTSGMSGVSSLRCTFIRFSVQKRAYLHRVTGLRFPGVWFDSPVSSGKYRFWVLGNDISPVRTSIFHKA